MSVPSAATSVSDSLPDSSPSDLTTNGADFAPLPLSNETGATDAIAALSMTDHRSEGEPSPRDKVKALVERTLATRPQTDADLVERAFAFASEKHATQTRMTGEPYIEHPVAVAGILAELGMDDVTIAAGLLHDVPEDCNVSYEEMQERFGAEVAHLVEGVTKLKHIRFDTKADKQAGNLRKLFLAMAGDVRVIIIKLADRLHNMRTLDPFRPEKKIEISEETLYIFAPIAHRLGIWRIKWELEDRAFKYLEPDVYKQIYALVQRKRDSRNAQVKEATELLQQRLHAEGIEAEVTGRPKHFYSIYQKMLKQGLKFDAIHDLIAIRVICNSNPDCYHALGIVHALWMQVQKCSSITSRNPNRTITNRFTPRFWMITANFWKPRFARAKCIATPNLESPRTGATKPTIPAKKRLATACAGCGPFWNCNRKRRAITAPTSII
jgi:GTP pyrophosphokinase